jgi:hypothetical protein
MIRTACLSIVALALLSLPSSASAQWGGCGAWGGYGGCGGAWGNSYAYNYGVGYLPPPPYYSVFPPVYYSPHITMRHYGASPYAWPAGFSPTAFAIRTKPMMVINQLAPAAADPALSAGAKSSQADMAQAKWPKPLRIDNPYITVAAR